MDPQMAEFFDKVMGYSEKPSKVFLQIIEYENQHTKYLLNTYNGFIEYFEHAFECIVLANYRLNFIDKGYFPKQRQIQLLIYTDNLETIYSSFQRLKGGFYTDVIILSRSTYESVIRMMFCSFYPHDADSVWLGDPQKGRVQFNVTNFVRDQLKVDWSSLYKLLCLHSHSNIITSLQRYGKLVREGQKEPIAFELRFEKEKIEMCINMITFLLWNFIYFFKHFFLSKNGAQLEKKLMTNINATEKLLSRALETSPNIFKERHQEALGIYSRLVEIEAKANSA